MKSRYLGYLFDGFNNSIFLRMAIQGYHPYLLVFIMSVPMILGDSWGLYLSYITKRPMSQVGKVCCYTSAISMSLITWFLGFPYIVIIVASILLFYLTKLYLKGLSRFMRTIHKNMPDEEDNVNQINNR